MSTLFTFGCSFSEEFSVLLPRTSPNTRVDYIEQYFNGIPPDSWPTMLSKKLGLNIKSSDSDLALCWGCISSQTLERG